MGRITAILLFLGLYSGCAQEKKTQFFRLKDPVEQFVQRRPSDLNYVLRQNSADTYRVPETSSDTIDDQFSQAKSPNPPPIDILWVLDNSADSAGWPSMSVKLPYISNNMNSFIGTFLTYGIDFKMGVTTTSYGYNSTTGTSTSGLCEQTYSGSGLTLANAQSDINTFRTLFTSKTNVSLSPGTTSESGVICSKNFFGNNTNWLRSEAVLVIIFISNCQDHTHHYPYSSSLSEYLTYLRGLKGSDSGKVKIFSIINNNTNTYDSPNAYGERYKSLATSTGGSWSSIDSSFDTILSGFSSAVVELTSIFPLQNAIADPSILKVYKRGPSDTNWTLVGSDEWEYLSDGNSVKFKTDHVPPSNYEVKVTYISTTDLLSFPLRRPVEDEDELEIYIDGVKLASDEYTYDSDNNTITFTTAPAEGASIKAIEPLMFTRNFKLNNPGSFLKSRPEGSFKVFVDDVEVDSEKWEYNSDSDSIVFEEDAMPEEGAKVKVVYVHLDLKREFVLSHPIKSGKVEETDVYVNGVKMPRDSWTYNKETKTVVFNEGFIPDDQAVIKVIYVEGESL